MDHIIEAYVLKEIGYDEVMPKFFELQNQVFAKTMHVNSIALMNETEQQAYAQHYAWVQQGFKLAHGIYLGDAFVGWSFGRQISAETYYMTSTGILPEHQGKRIYSNLLPKLIERISKAGFQIIKSQHALTNNAVIIPKLRAGFKITGIEVSDQFGTLLNLSYYTNSKRRDLLEFRVGHKRPDESLKQVLGLTSGE